MDRLQRRGLITFERSSAEHRDGWRYGFALGPERRGGPRLGGAWATIRLMPPAGFFPHERWLLPRAWVARFEGGGLPYVVDVTASEVDGAPVVDGLTILPYRRWWQPTSGRRREPERVGLTTAAFRAIPVHDLKQLAVLVAIHRQPEDRRRRPEPYPLDEWNEIYAAEGAGRGSYSVTDEFLAEVAAIYRRALAAGDPPVRAVQQAKQTTRSTAGRWVWMARRAGLLGPVEPGRAGG